MFYFAIENAQGQILNLSNNTERYVIERIEGLAPVAATISIDEIPGYDGAQYNSARVPTRNIVIYITLRGDIEKNRVALYKYCKVKEWVTMYYRNGVRDVLIRGIVEDIVLDYFSSKCGAQLSILCPQPYFKAAKELIVDISRIVDEFIFPFELEEEGKIIGSIDRYITKTVTNEGDKESGLIIELQAEDNDVVNPKIYNTVTGEMIGVNYSMQKGDRIVIDTNQGAKTVTLVRGGYETNIFNALMAGSTWLPIRLGDNVFTYECESGVEKMTITFRHRDLFEGV